jgi:hypothetical protein
LKKEILNDMNIIQCIKTITYEKILVNYKNWQSEAAFNKKNLTKFTCFSLTLQYYAEMIIKQTIYKILYSIEKLPEITRIINSDEPKMEEEIIDLWKQFFMNKIMIIINNLFEQDSLIINDLEFPFSYYFQINYYEKYYHEELDILRQDSGNNIEELIDDHIEDFRNNLISTHKNFENLQKYSELYYNDFIRIILSSYYMKLSTNKEKLDFVLRHLNGDKIVDDPFILHIYWWKYSSEILIQLKLVETFPNIFTKAQNDFIIFGKLDQYLLKESINLILQNICDDKPWKQDMELILSINYKIDYSKHIPNLRLLLICNDLLQINFFH